jgi:hypothetical protein
MIIFPALIKPVEGKNQRFASPPPLQSSFTFKKENEFSQWNHYLANENLQDNFFLRVVESCIYDTFYPGEHAFKASF